MNADIGILFLYHRTDDVARTNWASFKRHNPDTPIVPIFTGPIGDTLPQSLLITDCGPLAYRFLAIATTPELAWKHCDLAFMAGYHKAQKLATCERWILIEYDVWCNCPVREYASTTRFADIVGPTVTYPYRESDWRWFGEIEYLPESLKPFASGVVPLATTIISDAAMRRIYEYYAAHDFVCQAELRLATVAHALGYPPVSNSHPSTRYITWMNHSEVSPIRALWHPVKFCVPAPD